MKWRDSVGWAPRCALVLGVVVATCATGCAWKSVSASCSNVPNPVLLGPVDRVKGHTAQANAQKVAEVDVDVVQSITTSQHDEGDYTVTTTHESREGSNKASFAVLEATQGAKDVDVRLDGVHAGAWVFIPIAAVKNKFWVGVDGDAVRSSK